MGEFAQRRKILVLLQKQKPLLQDDASSNYAHNQGCEQYFEDDFGVSRVVFSLFLDKPARLIMRLFLIFFSFCICQTQEYVQKLRWQFCLIVSQFKCSH